MDKNQWLCDLVVGPDARFSQVDFDNLTPAEQVFICVWDLEAQVNNGGFSQYFFNSSGDNIHAVVPALQAIGAFRAADIAKKAVAMLGDEPALGDREARQELLDSMSEEDEERLSGLDDEFYAYPDDLTELLYSFVMQHRDQIRGA
jgi:hypothetical protein